jgi:hypothetical protein
MHPCSDLFEPKGGEEPLRERLKERSFGLVHPFGIAAVDGSAMPRWRGRDEECIDFLVTPYSPRPLDLFEPGWNR